jgi:hypothetical protein
MLSSTRVLALSLASRALPAESSRQGLLRAIAQQKAASASAATTTSAATLVQKRSLHRRRSGSTYATAAVAYADEDKDDRIDSGTYHGWRTRRFPDPRPPDFGHGVVDEMATMEQEQEEDGRILSTEAVGEMSTTMTTSDLVGLIHSDPLLALRTMPRVPASQLSELTARDLSDLLKNIYKTSPQNARLGQSNIDTDFQEPLLILRGLLFDLPSATGRNDAHLGRRFKRDLLSRFLRACTTLDCDTALQSTLKERLETQDIEGETFVQPDIWATKLANLGKWRLLVDLLSPSVFPVKSYTPSTIYRLMQAHLAMGMAYKIPSLFRMYADLDITPPARVFPLLVQAYLQSGDIDAARHVMQQSMSGTTPSDAAKRLAILKGYRELGRDKALESRVLEATTGMEEKLQVAMLQALMRLRMDDGDTAGVKELLARFDCDFWLSPEGLIAAKPSGSRLPADSQTHLLAFRMLAPSMSREQLEEAWRYLTDAQTGVVITDQLVTVLIRNLSRLGMHSTARAIITGKISEGGGSSYVLPSTYRPSVAVFNTLLELAARTEGWRGVEQTLKLFRSRQVKPDSQTLTTVISFVRADATKDPAVLANITNAVLRQSPDIKPTIDQVDLLLGQAVRAQARSAQLTIGKNVDVDQTTDRANNDDTNAQAGLVPHALDLSVRSIIQSLRARGVRSRSRSLATRLRLQAQSHQKSVQSPSQGSTGLDSPLHAAPSVRSVWDEMIARGYKPDKRHFLALMKGYADFGHMAECEDVIILARDSGMEPTRGMWMVLLTAYGHVRGESFDITRAEKAFQAMKVSEQGLDLPAVCAMIGIYQRGRHRHPAVDLALRLVDNLLETDQTPEHVVQSPQSPTTHLPRFTKQQFTDRSLAITTDALRLDHPLLSLQVISNFYASTTTLPSRVRDVIKSIRNRARARLARGIATPIDYEAMAHAEDILKIKSGAVHGRRAIGPGGIKRKVLRLFKTRKTRGNGGRKIISAREERTLRGQAIARAQANVE